VARLGRAGREHRRPVVLRHLFVRALDAWLVAARVRDAALELIRDDCASDTAKEFESAYMARKPVGTALGACRLSVGAVGGAEYRDEQLDRDAFTALDDPWLLPRVVDELFLTGAVILPHREVVPLEPHAVVLAVLRVAVAARLTLQVLEVEQLERDPRPLTL